MMNLIAFLSKVWKWQHSNALQRSIGQQLKLFCFFFLLVLILRKTQQKTRKTKRIPRKLNKKQQIGGTQIVSQDANKKE